MSERILDTAAFPIVRGRSDGLSEGYSARWISELEHILSREEPFVLLYVDHQADEAHSDQKARSIWLKNNRARMGEFCRGLIAVEPDAQLRAKRQAQGTALGQAFGMTVHVAKNEQEALAVAQELVSIVRK